MPRQGRDPSVWTCEYCGLEGFQTFHDAQKHELDLCQITKQRDSGQSRSIKGGRAPPGLTPLSTARAVAMGVDPQSRNTYSEDINSSGRHGKSPQQPSFTNHETTMAMRLMNDAREGENFRLPEFDCVSCQSLEIFQATSEDAADNGNETPVVPRQLGIRCMHCARSPLAGAPYGTAFPGSIGTMGASIRMVAEQHFPNCSMAPEHVREAYARYTDRGSKQDQDNREYLIDFCVEFCRRAGIVNRIPSKTGLMFAKDMQHTGESAGRVGPMAMMRPERPLDIPHGARMRPEGATGISATPLARRSKGPGGPREADREHGMPGYSAFHPQQPIGSPSEDNLQPYASGDGGPDSPSVNRQAHSRGQGVDIHQPYPHHAGPGNDAPGGPPPGYQAPPYPYPPYEMQAPPQGSSYPFFQDTSGSWICRYCTWIPPNYRDPGSIWNAQDHSPPPPGFLDQHLSLCRGYNHPHSGGAPQQPGMYPPGQPYMPHQVPPYGHPHGPPPPNWGPHGAPSPYHGGQGGMMMSPPPGAPPRYNHTPSPAGMEHHYPYSHQHEPHPPAGMEGGPMEHPGMMPPTTPRGPAGGSRSLAEGSEAAMDAAINHLMNADRETFALEARGHSKVGAQLVLDGDKSLLTDYFFYLMKQLRVCRFSESDRKTRGGKRENIAIGYGGLQCVHCAESPNSRKFFWSNVDRLANSFAEIPGHVLKCRRCPNPTKLALSELKLRHPEQMARLPRGSQKVFFRRMWRRLHEEDTQDEEQQKSGTAASPPTSQSPKTSPEGSVKVEPAPNTPAEPAAGVAGSEVNARSTDESARVLSSANASSSPSEHRVLLAIAEDKDWLSDMDCFIRSQLEVFCATEDDVSTAQSDRKYPIKLGQVGIRCIHCATMESEGARGTAVSFPYSISGIYESVREFQRLHLDSCSTIPEDIKGKLSELKGSSSLSSVLRKYYQHAAKALGLFDTPDGIRAGAETVPIESSAAFEFSGMNPRSVGSSMGMGSGSGGAFLEAGPAITPLESRKRKQPSSGDRAARKKSFEVDKQTQI